MLEITALTGAPEPLERGEADPGRQAEPHRGVDEGSRMSRVLLIEDDAETAREIMAELVDRGFEVDWAATGIEGLDKARRGDADVIDRRSAPARGRWSHDYRSGQTGTGL